MIYSLNGKILHTEPTFVVIECGGVGYQCYATMNTLRTLPHIGETATIYTQMLVREDAIELCGFSTTAERNCFTMLMSISGVGAKVALAILSVLTPEQVALSVSLGDSKTLTKANGVGNKLAQRIILELKDKIKKLDIAATTTTTDVPAAVMPAATGNVSQAIAALSVLGYTPDEVMPFMAGIDPSRSVEEIIAGTLKAIGKQ
ncbi:MAG TPA: Holliday junction branch migration protein RuvA [Ruminococcaceae bacterium]|nr:Holliday junction branch migration protein RuvA [Oscillospiraceae bacterium]